MDISNNIQAQSQTDTCLSKEFYFAFPGHYLVDLPAFYHLFENYIYFLGEPGTVVSIEYFGEAYTAIINSNNIGFYKLPNNQYLSMYFSQEHVPSYRGIKIISNKAITCHYLLRMEAASNGTPLLPIEQLSRLYYICPFPSAGRPWANYVNIISTSNNNTIKVTGNTVLEYTLQNLQAVKIKYPSGFDKALKIESKEKIAVFLDTECYAWVGGACNPQICQIYGYKYFDTTFILPLTQNYNNVQNRINGDLGDAFKILSVDNNNIISINDQSVTLQQYQSYEKLSVTSPTIIKARYPIFVYQIKRGCGPDLPGRACLGDPSINAIFPFNRLSKRYTIALPPLPYRMNYDGPQYYALIAIKNNALASIKVNGILLNSSELVNFVTIPGTDYVSGWIPLSGPKNRFSGSEAVPYIFEASDNFLLILDAYNDHDTYLFSAGGSMCNNLIPNLPTPNPNPSATPTPTTTPTKTPTSTQTPTISETSTPTPTTTTTKTQTPTPTPSKTIGASPTPTPTITPTTTITPTLTPTISITPSYTPTHTPTCTPTPSHTPPPAVCCYSLGLIIDLIP